MRPTRTLVLCLALALFSSLALPPFAVAATRHEMYVHQRKADDARKQANTQQKKADQLVSETRQIEDEMDALAGQISDLDGKIGATSSRRIRLEDQVAVIAGRVEAKQREVAAVKARFDAQVAALNERVNETYRSGDWAFISWLLDSSSVGDFLERAEYANRIMEHDEQIAAQLDETRAGLEQAEAELSRSLDEVQAKRSEVKAEEDHLVRLRTQRDSKLDAQSAAKHRKQELLAETKDNIDRLQEIAKAEDEESAKIASALFGTSSRGGGTYYCGEMQWPTPGHTSISSPYGMRYHPILHYNRMHTGIDIRAPSGAAIVAIGGGKVVWAGWRGGYGNVVMIDHGDGIVSVYAHMSRIGCSDGQRVSAGQEIGHVGMTGLATGPHLHFEIRLNGDPVNPLKYV